VIGGLGTGVGSAVFSGGSGADFGLSAGETAAKRIGTDAGKAAAGEVAGGMNNKGSTTK